MLITFEGIDNSGKSTQAYRLREFLSSQGHAPLIVKEPGGTEVSEEIRALLLRNDLKIRPVAEVLLFSASRAQLIEEKIRPALASGRIVICDRFYDSTIAYQMAGREMGDCGWIKTLQKNITGDLTPDKTFLLDIDPKTARSRTEVTAGDRIESEKLTFFKKVREAYKEIADQNAERVSQVDGTQPIGKIQGEIREGLPEGILT
jgi:dTMP kinase